MLPCLVHCFGKFLTEASVKYSLERTAEQSSQNLSTLTARGDTTAIIAVNLLLRLTASMFQSRQMKRCTESKVETFFTPLTSLYTAAAVLKKRRSKTPWKQELSIRKARANIIGPPQKEAGIKRAIWTESGGRITGGSRSSPPLHCWRILSKQGMECTPVFHNLFPHSSPLHIYKQSPKEEKKGKERLWEPCKYVRARQFSRAKRKWQWTVKERDVVKIHYPYINVCLF